MGIYIWQIIIFNGQSLCFSFYHVENCFSFLRSHLCFYNADERPELWKTNRFAIMYYIWELFNSSLNKKAALSGHLSIDETLYPMRHQAAFCQCNTKKPHQCGLLWKSLNHVRFPYTYKSVTYLPKLHTKDVEKQLSIKGKTISTDCLYTSI